MITTTTTIRIIDSVDLTSLVGSITHIHPSPLFAHEEARGRGTASYEDTHSLAGQLAGDLGLGQLYEKLIN